MQKSDQRQGWWNRRTQVIALIAGLLVWAGAFSWRATQPSSVPPAARTVEAHGRAEASPEKWSGSARKGPAKTAALPALRLDLLEHPLPLLRAEVTDLFASALPPPAPPPPPIPPKAAAPPAPDPFLEEARKLRVVAILQEDGQTVAFIADGNDVHTIKQGDVIRSRFRIKNLNDDTVVVSQPDGQKEVRLELTRSAGGGQK